MNGQVRTGTRKSLLLSSLLAASLLASPIQALAAMDHADHGDSPSQTSMTNAQVTSATPAATLRVALNNLLAEHVYLAARATSGALGGRQAEFTAAANALDMNSVDISKAIGSAYGPEAEAAFLPLWRSHIGMVVDYTQGVAAGDQAKQDKAVADLVGYTQDFGAFLSGANERLPKDVVADLVKTHVLTLKTVIDAQKAGDQQAIYASLREAYHHMSMVGDPLAAATAAKFPDKFPGQSGSPAADLRVKLNLLLAEHVYLAASATGGALGGRQAQFEAAAAQLDANSVDLANAIGSAYGQQAGAAFLPLWRSHIGMVVDYTVGKATQDQAKQDKAVADLVQYTEDFGAFLSGANENLPKDVVAGLVKSHALTLKDVIDAQAAGDAAGQFTAIRAAGGHMSMIADPLAEATVKKFPDKFGAAAFVPSSMVGANIQLFAFQPAAVQVPVGTTVSWTNQDAIQHSVTAGQAGAPSGAFDSGLFNQGESFSWTFAEPGSFAYFCSRHTAMQGVVEVTQ